MALPPTQNHLVHIANGSQVNIDPFLPGSFARPLRHYLAIGRHVSLVDEVRNARGPGRTVQGQVADRLCHSLGGNQQRSRSSHGYRAYFQRVLEQFSSGSLHDGSPLECGLATCEITARRAGRCVTRKDNPVAIVVELTPTILPHHDNCSRGGAEDSARASLPEAFAPLIEFRCQLYGFRLAEPAYQRECRCEARREPAPQDTCPNFFN